MTYVVALTGGISSGKSTIASFFATLGVAVIDTDAISRSLVALESSVLNKIINYFGPSALLPNGEINRPYLRHTIFNHPAKRIWLEQLLHPLIYQQSWRELNKVSDPYAIWVVPLLVEHGWEKSADRILVIDSTPEQQLARVINRDRISLEQAQAMLAVQSDRKTRLAIANDIINNSGTIKQISPLITLLHYRYLKLAILQNNKAALV